MTREEITGIVDRHRNERGSLIAILEDIQGKYRYLPEEALKVVAETTRRPLVDVFGVATFYRSFSLKPRGKHLCSVCTGTACHVRGAPVIVGELEREVGTSAGGASPDGMFSLETVNCLGACALGPIVVVDGHYFSAVHTGKVKKILQKARAGFDRIEARTDQRIFPVEVSCPRCNHSLMDRSFSIDGHPCIRVTVSFNRRHGWLRLSSLYGSYSVEYEHPIPQHTIVSFFCPYCHAELRGAPDCAECGAPMVPMIVRGGGMVQICSRRGCKGHMLDLNGVNF